MRKAFWFVPISISIFLACFFATSSQTAQMGNASGVIDPTCTSSLPCIEYDNDSSGPGIRGISLAGNGVGGSTRTNSSSAANGRAGLFGNDLSTSGSFNSGVHGLSVRGTGVVGTSSSGSGIYASTMTTALPAILAQNLASGSGIGIKATAAGTALVGDSTNANGVFGSTTASGTSFGGVVGMSDGSGGIGVLGETTQSNSTAVLGDAHQSRCVIGGCTGVEGIGGTDGQGVVGSAVNGASGPLGAFALVGEAGINAVALALFDSLGGTLIIARGSDGHDKMSLDDSGNMILAGTLTTNGTPLAARRTARGIRVGTYSSQQTVPSVEDFGKGQLINGQAYVPIDSAFAATIDSRADYLVFLTPRGDNRGLYVAQTSTAGFLVRESQGGRSTLAFDYRIVARPYGSFERRLPVMPPPVRTSIRRFSNFPHPSPHQQ